MFSSLGLVEHFGELNEGCRAFESESPIWIVKAPEVMDRFHHPFRINQPVEGDFAENRSGRGLDGGLGDIPPDQ